MKKSTFVLISLLVLQTLFSTAFAEGIYRWVDKDGKQHFSDRTSGTSTSEEFKITEISSIKTVKSKLPKMRTLSKKRKNKTVKKAIHESKVSRCNQLSTNIASIEKKLKTRLQAGKSDQYSKDLAELRWKKIKSC